MFFKSYNSANFSELASSIPNALDIGFVIVAAAS